MRPRQSILLALLTLLVGCSGGCKKTTNGAPVETPSAPPSPSLVYEIGPEVGLATPESVLHDPEADVYLVSNIDGSPVGKDGNGFIARFAPDGTPIALRWIDGATEGVELNAPKGMTLAGERLYVSDIDAVRVFDRRTGAPLGSIPVEGATFLNDTTTGPDGSVFVSDTGVTVGDSGFEPTGADAIYRVALGAAPERIASGPELGRPNGIVAVDDGIWVVTFGSGELYRVKGDGSRDGVRRLPTGGLDGIVLLPDGEVLISSWEGEAVYRGPVEGAFEAVLTGIPSPADIGYDASRGRLLIPVFTENRALVYEVR